MGLACAPICYVFKQSIAVFVVIVSEENGSVKDLMFISKLIRCLWLALICLIHALYHTMRNLKLFPFIQGCWNHRYWTSDDWSSQIWHQTIDCSFFIFCPFIANYQELGKKNSFYSLKSLNSLSFYVLFFSLVSFCTPFTAKIARGNADMLL